MIFLVLICHKLLVLKAPLTTIFFRLGDPVLLKIYLLNGVLTFWDIRWMSSSTACLLFSCTLASDSPLYPYRHNFHLLYIN